MKFDELINDGGPEHVKVRLDDGQTVRAPQFGDTATDRSEAQQRNAARLAEIRSEDIAALAALVREVDGDHKLGAVALAEALVDRGVTFRRGD